MITKAVIPAASIGIRLLSATSITIPKAYNPKEDSGDVATGKKLQRTVKKVTHRGGKASVYDPEVSENLAKDLAQEATDLVEGLSRLYTLEGKEIQRKKALPAQP